MRHLFIASFVALVTASALGCNGEASSLDEAEHIDSESAALTRDGGPVLAARTAEDPLVLEMERAPERFFTRHLSVRDDTGRSSARLRIVSNDADALEIFAASFRLRVAQAARATPAEADTAEREEDDVDEADDRVKILVFEEQLNLAPGVRDYALTVAPQRELKLPWKNYYFYTHKDCVDVTRLKLGRRVYVSVWSKEKASSDWSALVINDKLAWQETSTRCDVGSYELKTQIRTKKSNSFLYAPHD